MGSRLADSKTNLKQLYKRKDESNDGNSAKKRTKKTEANKRSIRVKTRGSTQVKKAI